MTITTTDTRPRYACPEHGPVSDREYDADYRCAHCGRAILAIHPIRESAHMVRLPLYELDRIAAECQCTSTTQALRELMEAHHADL